MTVSREVELSGHIIDSGMMQACFGAIMDLGGSFEVEEFQIGRSEVEESSARLVVFADTEAELRSIIHELHQNGANPSHPVDASLEPAPDDQVVPPNFYSTTNHPTEIRYESEWLPVGRIEMDCAVVVEEESGDEDDTDGDADEPRAYTKVLNAIEAGEDRKSVV